MKLEAVFRKHKLKFLIVFAIFLVLIILNYIKLMANATKTDGEVVVVIDAGHGGNDPGKVGTLGTLEKDINLSIALKLKEVLEQKGVKVVLTRTDDACLSTPGATNKKTSDMNNRVEIINSANADCLISIHQNSYTDSSVKGAQVFYYGSSEESKKLAEELQSSLISNVDSDNNRQCKEGNDYFILRKTTCPGVIVECGFLSCPEEEKKLIDETYQQKIAEAIAETVCDIYVK